jgi:hypothetical protein
MLMEVKALKVKNYHICMRSPGYQLMTLSLANGRLDLHTIHQTDCHSIIGRMVIILIIKLRNSEMPSTKETLRKSRKPAPVLNPIIDK